MKFENLPRRFEDLMPVGWGGLDQTQGLALGWAHHDRRVHDGAR